MKKLFLTTLTASAVLMNCAPKENNISPVQRGAIVNEKQPPFGGNPGAGPQRPQNPQQPQVGGTPAAGEVVNLTRFSKDLGFYSINDKKIPESVQKASASIFHLVMFTATEGEDSYSVNKRSEIEKREKEIRENINKLVGINSFERLGFHKQLEACLKYVKPEGDCVLMKNVVHGTAFLTGDGSTLITNGHVIEEYLKSEMALTKKTLAQVTDKSNKLIIFIFDQNNKLVFNPYDHQIVIERLPVATAASAKSEKFYGADNDYVQLRVSIELGAPLAWAKKGVEINRVAYAIGYPDCTKCELREKNVPEEKVLTYSDRSPAPNSTKEFEIAATKGNVIFPDDGVLGFYKMSPEQRTQIQKNLVFYTGDSQHGMSGGPILNESGEVVAVIAAGRSRKIKETFYRLSHGVIPPKFLVE